ncbi:deSI-like protein [Hibiscus syriacus]|uniref:DeSI-like protein n=1 Tax=Hibiscus syriacus TaxID=106335 RepID=A0A6A2ZEZ0_HIBSY|nr:protein MNN4-like [Hibiscus syriacus]KAE8690438.1 deSI-like protein [Hibiscus syriacus]
MFRARNASALFSIHFKTRSFCSTIKDSKNKNNNSDIVDGKIESNLSTFTESYRQLDNLNFMTAAKILFTQPPKKKKFGIDFHLVQLFFACMPSLAVYLVAQYARYEMRKMEAELEEKKKQEESKMKQEEAKMKQEEEERDKEGEQIAMDPELSEVKVRLGKLEEAVREIAVESKKQSAVHITKTQQKASEPGEDRSKSESRSSVMQDKGTNQKSIEQIPNADSGKARSVSPVSDATRKDQKGENRIGGPSEDAKI